MYGLKHTRRSNVIFAHSPTMVTGFPALVVARMFRRPLFIDHMDIKDPDTPRFIYKMLLKNSSTVFTISRYLEQEVRGLGRNAVYLPVFVDAGVFRRDASARARIRQGLGIGDKETVIGYAGSFSHIEGLPLLLEAFRSLSSSHENIRLMVIGGRNVAGSDNVPELIDRLALKAKVIVVPQQPHQLMPQYLSAFDVACSPKIDCAENRAANPIKIYEYMAVGLPMVLSAVGEVANIIENGVDGFLVKPGDEADLTRALEYVMRNPDSAEQAGQRAREKIVKSYTREVMLTTIRQSLGGTDRKENRG